MSWVPASTRAAFVVTLALGLVSAVPCSAISVLLHAGIIDQSITPVKPRVSSLAKHARGHGRHRLEGLTRAQALQPCGTLRYGSAPVCDASAGLCTVETPGDVQRWGCAVSSHRRTPWTGQGVRRRWSPAPRC